MCVTVCATRIVPVASVYRLIRDREQTGAVFLQEELLFDDRGRSRKLYGSIR